MSVDFAALDARRIAEAFGVAAWRATTPEELDTALDAAFAHNGPAFVDVVVESIADVQPPVFNWLNKMGQNPLSLSSVGHDPLSSLDLN